MAFRAIPSQLWLPLLLGSLSTLSVFWMLREDGLPLATPERDTASEAEIDRLSSDMQDLFRQMTDWQAFCLNPMETLLKSGARIIGRSIVSRDERWESRPAFLGQLEKDAVRRCQAPGSQGYFCFYTENEKVNSVHLLEVHLEFRDGRKQLSCEQLSPASPSTELMAFYTAYWVEKPGSFLRYSGRLRMSPRKAL